MSMLTPIREWYRNLVPPISAFERRDWLSNDEYWEGDLTPAGIRVGRETAMSLSTVWRCVTLLTQAVSTSPTEIVVEIPPNTRLPEYEKPDWLARPNPADPTMTSQEHFAQVATSLLLAGNSFTACLPSVMEPRTLLVLDPMAVDVKSRNGIPSYEVRNAAGQVIDTLDPMQVLHATWIRLPGQMRGLSPLEAARRSIGLGIVAEEFGSRFFGQGSTLSFGVEVPGVLSDDQRRQLTESLKARYSGTRNSHAIGVLTAGAKFVPGLQPTPEQAQFLATRKFSVEDIARWFGVPPHLVGSQEPGASSYNSVEQRSLEFRQYSVLPLAKRIEDPYQRLVSVPDAIRAPMARAVFRFNLDAVARADLQSRFSAYSSGIMAGVLKPNEARALEDLPPTQGGDQTYMQMQMVPTGSSRPPDALAASPPAPPARSDVNVNLNSDALTVAVPEIRVPDITVPETKVNVVVDTAAIAALLTAQEERMAAQMAAHAAQMSALQASVEALLVPAEKTVSRDELGRIVRISEKRGGQVRTVEVA